MKMAIAPQLHRRRVLGAAAFITAKVSHYRADFSKFRYEGAHAHMPISGGS